MQMTKNAIEWFEIPVLDFARAKQFYSAIFDFSMPEMQMGPNTMGFLLHEQGQGVGGAIVKGEGFEPSAQGSIGYLSGGTDLAVVLARVPTAGGTVLVGKTPVSPEQGFFAHFLDTEGNRLGLYSSK